MQKRLFLGNVPGTERPAAGSTPSGSLTTEPGTADCIQMDCVVCRKVRIATMSEFRHRRHEVKSVCSWMDDQGVLIREFASARRPINDVVHEAGNSGLAAVFIPEPAPNEADVPKIGLNP